MTSLTECHTIRSSGLPEYFQFFYETSCGESLPRRKPEILHVILTGRNAHPPLVELADTVTEMREVKQAY